MQDEYPLEAQMYFRIMIALGAALFMAAAAQPSFAQSGGAPVAMYRCGEGFDPTKAVGRTFSGTAQWGGMTKFHLAVTFNANCTVTDRTNGGAPRSEGEWEQTRDGAILWEPVKDGASVYKGEFQTDGSISGIMAAPRGYRGTFTLRPETGVAPAAGSPASKACAAAAIAGKTFSGQGRWDIGVHWAWTVTYNPDCTVTETVDQGTPRLRGQWSLTAGSVVWQSVDGTAEYRGVLQADGSIQGTLGGARGARGDFTLRPRP